MSAPLGVERALAIVLEATPVLPCEDLPYERATGRILQEEVRADHDYPPFDKALMDGLAVIAADLEEVPRILRLIEEIPAGADPSRTRRLSPGEASRIMTGAPLPPGADAVLMVEETDPVPGEPAAIRARSAVRKGENVARRGDDSRAGDLLLPAGEFIGTGEIGVLASCGRTRVKVGGCPRIAILATGDEIVAAESTPAGGQIRNSNGPLLCALARGTGAEARDLGIAPDDPVPLRKALERGLESDILVTSGGVSMGTRDLVAAALRAHGVEILFDRVAIKPGRPFTFGALRRGGSRGTTLVFGCPGNPVSSYVIFQVFAVPAIRRMAGFRDPVRPPVRGRLEKPVRQRPGRTGYHQARARWAGDHYAVTVLPTSGSADFVSCARGNALAIVPAETAEMAAGEIVDLLLLDDHADR